MLINQVLVISVFTISVCTTGLKIREFAIDIGKNLTLSCPSTQTKNVMWVREGKEDQQQLSRLTIQENGSLFLMEVDRNDSGIYTCSQENGDDDMKTSIKVRVRTPPPTLAVTVHPSTILALLIWQVNDTGGYPIIYFTAQYRLTNSDEDWKPISPNRISPNSRQIEVYKLEPNTTYAFRVWGTNQLGKGDVVEAECHTLCNNQELELARHFLQGVDKFDARMWIIAVGVVMSTLVLLGIGTCLLLYQECRTPSEVEDQETIELVPNIILNPGFDENSRTQQIPPDENSNCETTTRLNNNTVIQPRNV